MQRQKVHIWQEIHSFSGGEKKNWNCENLQIYFGSVFTQDDDDNDDDEIRALALSGKLVAAYKW